MIFIDIDGTLIDENDDFQPHVKQFIVDNKDESFFFWSGGGYQYARTWLERFEHANALPLSLAMFGAKDNRLIAPGDVVIDDLAESFTLNPGVTVIHPDALR